MGDYDEPAVRGPGATRRFWTVLAVVGALAAGLVAGYLLRGAAESPAPPPVAAPSTTVPPPPPPAATPPPSPCVEVAQGGSDLLAQLEQAARSIGALDPAALRVVLDEVQRLRDQLQADVDGCRTQVGAASPTPPG